MLDSLNEEKATLFFANQLPLEDNETITALNSSRETLYPLSQLVVVLIACLAKINQYTSYIRGELYLLQNIALFHLLERLIKQ